jgi:hypothetical protein
MDTFSAKGTAKRMVRDAGFEPVLALLNINTLGAQTHK